MTNPCTYTYFRLILSVITVYSITMCSTQKEVVSPEPIETRIMDTVFVDASTDVVEETAPYRASHHRTADLIHTNLDISFNFEERTVLGTAELEFTPLFYPINSLVLDAKSFDIDYVRIGDTDLDYLYELEQITIELDKTYHKDETFIIRIGYSAHPYRGSSNGSLAISDDKGLYFVDPMDLDPYKPTQIWTQGETESSSKWFPTIDKPNERTTQTVSVTVPSHMITLSNGTMTNSTPIGDDKRKDTWEMKQPHAPYLFMLAIGDLHRTKDMWNHVPLEYIVEHDYADDAKLIFNHTPEMLAYFSDLLDYPYPWAKYSQVIVRDYVSGAMENTTASLYGQFLQRPAGDLLDNGNDRIVAHELFHHWFGDLVTCESWSNLTLNEGFANYSEFLWFNHKYGEDAGQWHRYTELQGYLAQATSDAHALIDFHYEDKEDMFDAHSYNKGGFVMHMLRDIVGDEAFFRSLNHYLNEMKFKAAEVHDLRLAFEDITGMDLNWFFNQWFLDEGHPVISFEYQYLPENEELQVSVSQTQVSDRGWSVFTVPTEIEIHTQSGEKHSQSITLDEEHQVFSIALASEPTLIILDPERKQLIEYAERPDQDPLLLYQLSSSVWDRMRAMGRASEINDEMAMKSLFDHGLTDPFSEVRISAIQGVEGLEEGYPATVHDMAMNDAHSNVRQAAIKSVSDLSLEEVQKLLNDPSNRVQAAAAVKLIDLDSHEAIRWADKHQNSTSQAILQSVGDIYHLLGKRDKQAFFEKAADRMSFETLFPFYTTWGKTLSSSNPDIAIAQLEKWSKMMQADDTDIYKKYAILTAFQPIAQGTDRENIEYTEEQKATMQQLIQLIGMEAMKLISQ